MYNNLPEPFNDDQYTYYLREYLINGDQKARNLIIEHTLRFVLFLAQKFSKTKSIIYDLFSEGVIGLTKAIDSYNLDLKTRFISYASKVIQNEMYMYFRTNQKYSGIASLDYNMKKEYDDENLNLYNIIENDEELPQEKIIKEEEIKTLYLAIQSLAPLDKSIIISYFNIKNLKSEIPIIYTKILKYVETPLHQKDIAGFLNISQSYISKKITIALQKLKLRYIEFSTIKQETTRPKNKLILKINTEIKKDLNKTATQIASSNKSTTIATLVNSSKEVVETKASTTPKKMLKNEKDSNCKPSNPILIIDRLDVNTPSSKELIKARIHICFSLFSHYKKLKTKWFESLTDFEKKIINLRYPDTKKNDYLYCDLSISKLAKKFKKSNIEISQTEIDSFKKLFKIILEENYKESPNILKLFNFTNHEKAIDIMTYQKIIYTYLNNHQLPTVELMLEILQDIAHIKLSKKICV